MANCTQYRKKNRSFKEAIQCTEISEIFAENVTVSSLSLVASQTKSASAETVFKLKVANRKRQRLRSQWRYEERELMLHFVISEFWSWFLRMR